MADGWQHRLASVYAAPVAGVAAAYLSQNVWVGTAVAAGCLLGIWLTPDLDLLPELEGWRISALWKLYWYPYARMIPHRADISHTPILGTAVRVVYLFMPFILAAMAMETLGVPVLVNLMNFPHLFFYGAAIFCGLVVSDFLHWLMDGVR